MTVLKCSSGSGPPRPMTRPGVATPAQLTAIRSSPSSVARSTAACTCASSRTSAATKRHCPRARRELLDERRAGGGREVDDDDGRAVGGEAAGGGAAEAGAAAGDEGDGGRVQLHGRTFRASVVSGRAAGAR